ncbi:hypothetical protein SADUNF_Sadunf03G0116800 [Salix dunnii]|uniref:Uncharacterized protein n=1 Tax=Salix dunnii TaxID=1413687 RepID=A0A835N4C9_9ROSI|nr:hypothetical protein SADUNF_Sadunf03G0116800 [Salix dunnii]
MEQEFTEPLKLAIRILNPLLLTYQARCTRVAQKHEHGRREARTGDEAYDQPITKLIRPNPHGHYDYGYSTNEDLFWHMECTNTNHKE